MAPNKPAATGPVPSAALPNRPEAKMPPVAKGFRIQKRPIPGRLASAARAAAPPADPSGYLPAPRAAHTAVVYVRSSSPFMGLVSRVRKALAKTDRRPGSRRDQTLDARVAALKQDGLGQGRCQGREGDDDVVLVGTGKAIAKTVQLGTFLARDRALVIVPRTRTLRTVDDLVAEGVDHEDGARVRHVSCLEVGVRWRL